jgi:large subunit ribosomal protein L13
VKTKIYKNFSGFPSGQRERTFERVMNEDPTFPLKHAVKGMLPKSRLGKRMITRLLLYPGADHPHAAQVNAGSSPKPKKSRASAVKKESK